MVSVGASDEERAWAADKRDFVADSRDDIADSRDATAELRDAAADARDAELRRWDEQLDARAEDLGMTAPSSHSREAGEQGRDAARALRSAARRQRDEARRQRDDATERRLFDAPATLLALAFAGVAEQLYDATTYDEVLARIAEAAVATIAGCELASVTLAEQGEFRTAASTDESAAAVDLAQYDVGEGPCLDALESLLVDAPSFPDERWPALGARPTDQGVRSATSYRLATAATDRTTGRPGSLNTYGRTPAAFDAAAHEVGVVLAAHASLAARAVGERASLEQLGRQFEAALSSRDVIGQAKGILMERLRVTPEDAFEILRRSSQRLNLKLREVAQRLAETGQVDDLSSL